MIGVLLTFAGTVIAGAELMPALKSNPPDQSGAIYFAALNDLFGNYEALDRCLHEKDCTGINLQAENLRVLNDTRFDDVAKLAYGEEAHLSELVRRQQSINPATVMKSVEVKQLRFEAMFLAWYLTPHALPHLSVLQKSSFSWRIPLPNCSDERGYVVIDDRKITCFSDYLGYLD